MELALDKHEAICNKKQYIEFKLDDDSIVIFNKINIKWYCDLIVKGEKQDIHSIYEGFLEKEDFVGFLDWIKLNKFSNQDEFGFNSDSEDENIGRSNEIITPKNFNKNRQLKIYTWGRAFRKNKPDDSQCNFNATIINGRRKGINLKKYNGLSEEVQYAVTKSNRFPNFITMVLNKIEKDNLDIISINCTKGRHRSVTVAEYLKRRFYPESKIYHIELGKTT